MSARQDYIKMLERFGCFDNSFDRFKVLDTLQYHRSEWMFEFLFRAGVYFMEQDVDWNEYELAFIARIKDVAKRFKEQQAQRLPAPPPAPPTIWNKLYRRRLVLAPLIARVFVMGRKLNKEGKSWLVSQFIGTVL